MVLFLCKIICTLLLIDLFNVSSYQEKIRLLFCVCEYCRCSSLSSRHTPSSCPSHIHRSKFHSFIAQNSKMMIPLLILLLLTLHHVQCVDRVIEKRLNRLAFGSCNKVHSNVSDEIWKSIETFEPEMFAYVIVF